MEVFFPGGFISVVTDFRILTFDLKLYIINLVEEKKYFEFST